MAHAPHPAGDFIADPARTQATIRTACGSAMRGEERSTDGTKSAGFGIGSEGIAFHPVAFWCGTVAVTLGVVLHLPMYLGTSDTGYKMGMAIDAPMKAGMVLIVVVLATTSYGFLPSLSARRSAAATLRVKALDDVAGAQESTVVMVPARFTRRS